ncbi:MAG: AraC family transcriptional regulator [Prevotella sp.]|jgi:AraC-like DNA-binding protein|nr:AraC family transcriptional regulator [Prevotella sp.]MBR1545176.1 AraC family transcriptional regulator [Prevotella sp.]
MKLEKGVIRVTRDEAEATRFAAFDRAVKQGRLYTQQGITREKLCELMGVDRTTFSRIIRKYSGCQNMNDYLNQKRLRYAEQLLRQYPNYTINAIMQDSGFATKSTFTQLFKKVYGMTPSEFRNKT